MEALEDAFFAIANNAAAGIDGVTRRDYEADLGRKLDVLHERVQSGAYRATPSRRVYIPKSDGGLRPLAVAALKDKIVQRAVVDVLNALLTRRISSASATASGRGEARTTRSTPSRRRSSAPR